MYSPWEAPTGKNQDVYKHEKKKKIHFPCLWQILNEVKTRHWTHKAVCFTKPPPSQERERAGATSKTVSVYHKCTMIHTLSMIFPEYPKSKT